ncbi:AtpZ/AtpI family protein [Hymenobacter psychrotolerans]|uniref:Putative F0F1-ATPase subunit Ca2+/Mg2+ transporter n=1 Tax=Hymenobacter psychrotolerans DSM 18569 TaxID=1121959 RepID=A0A1M6P9K6_9BACT|nr:AtpZ/AtpI family protein [Hymenobacter psychrotolerans]SHK04633.1 Putative F0F1-ATPase subunit Ca2+/Mg2+ transporter [Hymenobacter psychrotolerans DSM 18569]
MAVSTPDPQPPRGSNFARFMGVGFQMLATIGACTWLGLWLDKRFGLEPWGTVGLTLFGVFAAMYLVIREVSEK